MRSLSKLDLQEWQHYKKIIIKKINRKLEKEKFRDTRLGKAMRERGKREVKEADVHFSGLFMSVCSPLSIRMTSKSKLTYLPYSFIDSLIDTLTQWLIDSWLTDGFAGWMAGLMSEKVWHSKKDIINTYTSI